VQTALDFASQYWVWLFPATLILVLLWFLQQRRLVNLRMERQRLEEYMRIRHMRESSRTPDEPSAFQSLLGQPDVTLRLLEEVYEVPRYPYSRNYGSADAIRLQALDGIQSELRDSLRNAVKAADFSQTKDRILALLDQVRAERAALQQKEPFNDIQDPERSLLIDIMSEIDGTKSIVRQKALQLASIIKIKHQDLAKLQTENAKAAVWTKWGTAGTVVFGLLSIVLSILTIKS